jgi:selenocysteine-specific elongation factor
MSEQRRTLILGTAGHVDHGKTSLVKALTGVDTDRLQEERRRGISIELGFAHAEISDQLRLGIVDVPGHERFVRQMVAGAGGMDLAMLLIAADEGVMPQTREHLDVLQLLGVRSGLVVITKTDLAEPVLIELVRAEIEELVQETFLEGAPVVAVSSTTGEGIEELRERLLEVARTCPRRRLSGDFRLPVDRVFAMPGAGVVVTGTAWQGEVRAGQTLRLMPQQRDLRVREVQSHGRAVEWAGAGERVALSLHGVKREDVGRGDQLVSGPAWEASKLVGIALLAVRDPQLAARIRNRARFHVHHAAREVWGRLDLLEDAPSPGSPALARLILEGPIVARPGDRLVLRTWSPMLTVAGATVLEPWVPKGERRAHTLQRLRKEQEHGSERWPFARLAHAGLSGLRRGDFLASLGMLGQARSDAEALVENEIQRGKILGLGEVLFDTGALESAATVALQRLRKHQRKEPLTVGVPKEELRQSLGFQGSSAQFSQLLAHWSGVQPIFVRDDRVRADSEKPELSVGDERELRSLEGRIREASPLYEATDDELRSPQLRLLVEAGSVTKLGGRLIAHRAALADLRTRVKTHFERAETLEVAHVKEWTGASRKFVVPLLEWLDAQGVTAFDGKERREGPNAG